MSNHLTVKSYHGLSGFAEVQQSWQMIIGQIENYHFVQHPSWHYAIQKWLLPEQVSYVLIEDGRHPVALIPVIVQKHLVRSLGCHTVISPQHDHIALSDWVCSPEFDINSFNVMIPRIIKALGVKSWDKFVFDSFFKSFLVGGLHKQLQYSVENPAGSYFSTYVAYKKTAWFDCSMKQHPVSVKMRRNIKRLKLQAEKLGNVELQQVCDPDELPEAFNIFLNIESSGWKGVNGTSSAIKFDFLLRGFYSNLLGSNETGFKAEIYLLKIGGLTVAAQIVVSAGRNINILKTAYDKNYAKYSPGSILLNEMIDMSIINETIDSVNLVTDPEWAKRWHPNRSLVYKGCIYNNTTTGSMVRRMDELNAFARSTYKEFLQRQ